MFRVGDKGVTRNGTPYEVTGVDAGDAHHNDYVVVASVGDDDYTTYTRDGRFYATAEGPDDMDLMPPIRTPLELAGMSTLPPMPSAEVSLTQTFMLAIINGAIVPRSLGDSDETIAIRTKRLADALIKASNGL